MVDRCLFAAFYSIFRLICSNRNNTPHRQKKNLCNQTNKFIWLIVNFNYKIKYTHPEHGKKKSIRLSTKQETNYYHPKCRMFTYYSQSIFFYGITQNSQIYDRILRQSLLSNAYEYINYINKFYTVFNENSGFFYFKLFYLFKTLKVWVKSFFFAWYFCFTLQTKRKKK